jgi:hypothetical protein
MQLPSQDLLHSLFCGNRTHAPKDKYIVHSIPTTYPQLVWTTSPIGSGNWMNNVLIPKCICSIFTETKNFIGEECEEDREVTVAGPSKLVGPGQLHLLYLVKYNSMSKILVFIFFNLTFYFKLTIVRIFFCQK